MLRKSLIQFSVVGLCCVPSLFFTWGQTVVEVMKIMVTFSKVPCIHCCTQCPDPAAGHHRPTPLPETWTLTDKSGSVSCGVAAPFSWVLVHTRSACACQESVSQSWVSSGSAGGVNGDLLQEGLCHTQVRCTQSPCPCSSPLLTRTSAGDTQTQLWLQSQWGLWVLVLTRFV